MSLILGYANKNNAIIMSDGRAGENGSLSEFYNKTRKINDNIIIGFAGFAEPIEHFLNHIIKEMGTEINQYYIDDFWDLMTFFMNDKNTQDHLHSSFIIIGRDKHNQMHTSIIGDNTSYKLKTNLVSTPRFLTIGGTIDGKIIHDIYTKNIMQYHIPIKDCMQSTICEVAKLDSSVNTKCFSTII
jgi:hypothetical protein